MAEIIEIHNEEILTAGGLLGIRDIKLLESAAGAVQATFDGKYVMNIFEMAATYINSIVFNHPFVDGNKRAAAASALTFLYLNGYLINESYEEELADIILNLINRKINKRDIAKYFEIRSEKLE